MAKKKLGYRTMGDRTVSFTITFSVADYRNVTDRAFTTIENALEDAIDDVVKNSILAYPVSVQTSYNRQVEVRPPYSLD